MTALFTPGAGADTQKASKLIDLTAAQLHRLNAHAASKRWGSGNEICRRGIEAELARLDAITEQEQTRAAKLTDIARARGVDLDTVINELHRTAQKPGRRTLRHRSTAAPKKSHT